VLFHLSLYVPFGLLVLVFFYWLCCWTKSGKRVIEVALRRHPNRSDWNPLPTPRRTLFIRTLDTTSNAIVAALFRAAVADPRISEIIEAIVGDEMKFGELHSVLHLAEFWRLYPRLAQTVAAWAQTRDRASSNIVLGLEWPWHKLGLISTHAVGHELVHVAQEVREHALRAEWDGLDVIRATLLELEAHLAFKLVAAVWLALFVIPPLAFALFSLLLA